MPKTTTADSENHVCPLCGERLANDHQHRGFVRHVDRAPLITLAARGAQMDINQRAYFDRTGRCPFEIGQRDVP
jgi:hypothetical protein